MGVFLLGRAIYKPFVLLAQKPINFLHQLHKFFWVLLNRSLLTKLFPARIVLHGQILYPERLHAVGMMENRKDLSIVCKGLHPIRCC